MLQETLGPIAQQLQEVKAELDAVKEAKQEEPAKSDPKDLLGLNDLDDDKFEDLSNKQILTAVCDAFDAALRASNTNLKAEVVKDITPALEKVNKIEQVAYSLVAQKDVETARSKYSDFDDYKEDIVKVMQQYPVLSYEDAYVLAKAKSPGRQQVETERPMSHQAAPAVVPSNEPGVPQDAYAIMAQRGRNANAGSGTTIVGRHGIVGFRDTLNHALSSVLQEE